MTIRKDLLRRSKKGVMTTKKSKKSLLSVLTTKKSKKASMTFRTEIALLKK